ncbi:MAG: type II secretion system F family protein [Deltaproteobacteria bacterium]|nr:type II secretion system F family protein [Deltaproteobacteria bacterium]
MPWSLAAAALAALLTLAAAFLFLLRESRRALALDRRLQAVRAQAVSAYGESGKRPEDASGASYLSAAVVAGLRVAAILVPVGAAERAKIGALLGQAGFQQRDALAVFLSLKMILMLAAGVAAGMLAAEADLLDGNRGVIGLAGLAGAVMGGLLPEAALRRLGARRHRKLARGLPDALDLMVLCVEAGYTFERALSMVSEELRPLAPELAAELGSVEAQLRLGADRRSVLQDLCERTGAQGLQDFAMTVIQGERYGTPMGQSIQNIAANERLQRAARIEAAAGRLPVIMSLPMLLLVVPGIILLMGGPAFLVAIQALSGLGSN